MEQYKNQLKCKTEEMALKFKEELANKQNFMMEKIKDVSEMGTEGTILFFNSMQIKINDIFWYLNFILLRKCINIISK